MTTNVKPVGCTEESDDFGRDDTDEDFARAGMLAYQASKKELGYDSDEFDLERCSNTINEREDEDDEDADNVIKPHSNPEMGGGLAGLNFMKSDSDNSALHLESELSSAMATYHWGKQKSKSKKKSGGSALSLKKYDSIINKQQNLILKKLGSFLRKRFVRGVNL